jgi:transcriptional regulator with XRE-family HTH domain
MTVSASARIERGEANPTWTTVTQIARGLRVSLAELAASVEKMR